MEILRKPVVCESACIAPCTHLHMIIIVNRNCLDLVGGLFNPDNDEASRLLRGDGIYLFAVIYRNLGLRYAFYTGDAGYYLFFEVYYNTNSIAGREESTTKN